MSTNDLSARATALASRKYLTLVRYEPEGNGTPDYVALHPEIPDCIAQGNTIPEARASLDEATIFWIQCLLEDNQPVPDPMVLGDSVFEAVNKDQVRGSLSFTPISGNLHLHLA